MGRDGDRQTDTVRQRQRGRERRIETQRDKYREIEEDTHTQRYYRGRQGADTYSAAHTLHLQRPSTEIYRVKFYSYGPYMEAEIIDGVSIHHPATNSSPLICP